MDEARLLTCVYLESLSNGVFYPSTKFAANFCCLLAEHGDDQRFQVVTPRWLLDHLPWGSCNPTVKDQVVTLLGSRPQDEGLLLSELTDLALTRVDCAAQGFLAREGWVGTTAHIAYSDVRSPGAHFFGSPGGVLFSRTTWRGQPFGRIGFEELHGALTAAVTRVRALSVSSGLWFGNPDVA
jgi:hypothetical protein